MEHDENQGKQDESSNDLKAKLSQSEKRLRSSNRLARRQRRDYLHMEMGYFLADSGDSENENLFVLVMQDKADIFCMMEHARECGTNV